MAGDDVMVRIAERLERERAALAEQLAAEKRARKEAEENWANMSDALTACEREKDHAKAVADAAELRIRGLQDIIDAQQRVIAWYRDEMDYFEFDDGDLPKELVEAETALRAAEAASKGE